MGRQPRLAAAESRQNSAGATLSCHGVDAARDHPAHTKEAYYEAIYASQRRWHENDHDIWPWIDYLVGVLAAACDDFEMRVAARRNLAVGSKQDQVRQFVIGHAPQRFRVRDIRAALPGVSDPTIRLVLGRLRREGEIEVDTSDPSGPHAAWRRRGAGARLP